jgi:hypothetical protein
MSRRGIFAALVIFGCLTVAAAANAQLRGRAVGPRTVHPGRKVRYRADGFQPRSEVSVTIQPRKCIGSNGCAVGFHRRWHTSASGSVRATFRFPRHYAICAGVECGAHPRFEKGSYAQVALCDVQSAEGEGQEFLGCAVKMVRVGR